MTDTLLFVQEGAQGGLLAYILINTCIQAAGALPYLSMVALLSKRHDSITTSVMFSCLLEILGSSMSFKGRHVHV